MNIRVKMLAIIIKEKNTYDAEPVLGCLALITLQSLKNQSEQTSYVYIGSAINNFFLSLTTLFPLLAFASTSLSKLIHCTFSSFFL